MTDIFDILETKDTKQIIKYVEENQDSLGKVDDNGNTPLIIACKYKLADVVLKLLDYGADKVKLSHINDDSETALYISCQNANNLKMEEVILKMLEFGADAVRLDHVDDNSTTALQIICEKKIEKIALKMLEFGADAVSLSQLNMDDNTALMIACENNLEKVALKILEFTPDESNIGLINSDNETALQIAIDNNLSNVVLKMLDFGPKEIAVNMIDDILLETYNRDMKNVFMKLLEFSPNYMQLTPLVSFLNIDNIQLELIDKLLEYGKKHGIYVLELDSVDKNGNTALILALKKNLKTVIIKLLEFGADVIKLGQVNKENKTALTVANYNTLDEDIIMKMLDYGPDSVNLGKVTNDGNTALMIACLAKKENIILKMLEYGADAVNLGNTTNDGFTALMISCVKEMENIALRILDFGDKANISSVSKIKKDTALTFTTALNLEKVALKLLEFGPNKTLLNHTRYDGSTALMWAIKNKMTETVFKMLEFGEQAVNLYQKTEDGSISAHIMAKHIGNEEILKKIEILMAPLQIPYDTEVYDYVMMETHKLVDWLNQDKYNIVIAYNNTYTGMNINDIRDSSGVALFYGCKERSGLIGPSNVIRNIRLYDIQKLGLIINGYIDYDDIEKLWDNADIVSRVLSLRSSGNIIINGNKVVSVVSSGIMDRQEGLVSGIHCNNDGGYIYKLDVAYIKFGDKPDTPLSGGSIYNKRRTINEKIKMLENYILSKGTTKLSKSIINDIEKLK